MMLIWLCHAHYGSAVGLPAPRLERTVGERNCNRGITISHALSKTVLPGAGLRGRFYVD